MSFFTRLEGVFFGPKPVFEALAEKPVWVEVHDGEKLITRKGEPYARPGEMVTINLKSDLIDVLKAAGEISVTVVER